MRNCARLGHRWTAWGPFEPVFAPILTARSDKPPTSPEPIKAYRWRECECGAAERETYADHTRKIFPREAEG